MTSPLAWVLFLAIMYWAWDKDKALVFYLMLITSAFISALLKILFHVPRPFINQSSLWAVPEREQLILRYTYSFPSLRSMIFSMFYSFYAIESKQKSVIYLGAFSLLLVSFARLLLGVNYLEDVIVGGLIGALLGYIFWYIDIEYLYLKTIELNIDDSSLNETKINEAFHDQQDRDSNKENNDLDEDDDEPSYSENMKSIFQNHVQEVFVKFKHPHLILAFLSLIALLVFTFLVFLVTPLKTFEFALPVGLLAGLAIGSLIENKYIMFPSKPPGTIELIVRIFVGTLVYFSIYAVFQLLSISLTLNYQILTLVVLLNTYQYFFIALSITVVVPYLITKIEVD